MKCLEGSRGDTLSDEDILQRLRYLTDHGTVYSRVIAKLKPRNLSLVGIYLASSHLKLPFAALLANGLQAGEQ